MENGASVEEPLDIELELEEVLKSAEPDLKDALRRGFTNAAVERSKDEDDDDVIFKLTDIFFVDGIGNQISVVKISAFGCRSFHLSRLGLSLNNMKVEVSARVGDASSFSGRGSVTVEGVYKAACPALQALLPVTADGRIKVTFSGMTIEGSAGLEIKDDCLYVSNTDFEVSTEEFTLNVFHYVPKSDGGEELVTSEITKDRLDKLPLVEKLSGELYYVVQQELFKQLNQVLTKLTSISRILGENPFLIEAFSTRVASASSSGNNVVDMILMEVRKNFLQKCSEVLELPDLQASFSNKIGLMTVHGEFETNNGWLLDLSTIDRTNDVTLSMGVSKCSLVVAMALAKMRVGFNEYRLKFMNLGPTGRIEAIIGKNSIHMKISAGVYNWKPYARIDDLTIQYFGDVDIHITGLGPLNWLVSTISTWISGHIKNIAIPIMENQIKGELQRAIDQIQIWNIISNNT